MVLAEQTQLWVVQRASRFGKYAARMEAAALR
jgi:hypothetical protein